MAQTTIIGNDGNFSFGTPTHGGLMNRWRASWAYVITEITSFSNSNNRDSRAGLPQVSGTVTGIPQKDVADGAPDADVALSAGDGSVTLTAAANCTWSGTAVFNNISLDVNKVGDALLSFDFLGGEGVAAGDWAESWDETP